MAKEVKRLYTHFQPSNYKLCLDLDRDKMKFTGKVVIAGQKAGRPSKRLTFHQSGLTITSAHIVRRDKTGEKKFKAARINNQDSFDEVRLHSDEILYPGSYTINLEFRGRITRAMNGVYPCYFKHEDKDKQLIATQFESHHAREVFPCIDEPEAKATFDLSLVTPKGETVLANTPVKLQKAKGDMMHTEFEQTPRMSTYLLAFVSGEIGYKQARTRHGVVVRAYATPDNVEFTQFALDTAVKCLDFFNDYFAIDYPLPKCDLVALPDFASGAMENWGLITFREQTFLVDPDNSTLSNKQYVALVVAHELAHQWFGNLVTMRWWTDLWLNEGFASWIEFLATDKLYPEWEVWTQFAVDEQQQALKLDALENTHPVEAPVNHPDEIRSIFDAISYSKGASVIHMLHEYLGAEVFQIGLRHYLNKHAYSNTLTTDLWDSLEEISGKPVKDFMHRWTAEPGFPLVQATVDDAGVSLKQERFYQNPKAKHQESRLWPIPLQSNEAFMDEQLNTEHANFKSKDTHEFKLNRGQSGFYRTVYNATHLSRLGEQIKKGSLTPIDRLGILSDLFEAAKAGKADTADALEFLTNFQEEDNYAVWDVIAASLGGIRLIMGDDKLRDAMKPYTRKLIKRELERLGWDRKAHDSHFDRLLRPIILGLAANSDEPDIVNHCRKLFDSIKHTEEVKPHLRVAASTQLVKRGVDIDPDMRGVVFGTIARIGDKKDFEKLLKLHDQAQLSEERTTLAAALTGFKQPELITKALNMIDSNHVRLQDVAYWVAYSFLNRHARQATWEWLKDNWKWLEKNLGTDLSFYRTPIYAARVHSGDDFTREYVEFFKPRLSPALDRSYKQGLEMLEWQSAWKKRDYKEVLNFFSRQ